MILLSPLSWLLVAALAGLASVWFAQAAWCRWVRIVAVGLATFSFLAMTPMFANLLVGWLEEYPPKPDFCVRETPSVAVVLSGGVDHYPDDSDQISVLSLASRRRADKAIAWWQERPGRKLVFVGGSRWGGEASEGRLLANYALRFGVDPDAVSTEGESSDTWENAFNVAALRPVLPRRVVLVTSAMHMPRAEFSMRKAGFEVCALRADWHYVPFRRLSYLIPSSGGLRKTESALHEIVGLLYYRVRFAGGKAGNEEE
ncbi:hypothetical protein CSC70_10065 [Pseudoxanthomonas kalamensis DSM 18571]|uniref:YdcF family protein n=1 Tax=Pseudoxanthomonas kalamensis TaxID=289483 RepID=UPI0013918D2E|nr:YdcF family protein [Pseudoxanthomonas kalamensis]KAF1710009.1 hypothetical protein CSC70_10065 [Pseudoxanthomonas kalamensis DSM 18571]